MFIFKEKQKLIRKEKRFLFKLKLKKRYLYTLSVFILFFSPVKRFLIFSSKGLKSVLGIVSFSIYNIFGFRIGYIDDFIVNKKSRGKGIGTKLFSNVLKKIKKNNCDYSLLISSKKRKASHKLYKKFGFTIISLGIGIIAFKKIRNKNYFLKKK